LALALALLALARIRRSLTPEVQPFGHAAFASALTISLANFEITTDSWWAALVASAYLFAALGCHAINRTSLALEFYDSRVLVTLRPICQVRP